MSVYTGPNRTGLVFFRNNNGFHASGQEIIEDHGQLPQFLPRTRWPAVDIAKFKISNKMMPTEIDWDDENNRNSVAAAVASIYPNLPRMPPYSSDYDGVEWIMHVGIVHNILARTLAKGLLLKNEEMGALIRIVSYGMYNSMTHFPAWETDGPVLFHTTTVDELAMDMYSGRYDLPGLGLPWYRGRLAGRRWIVVPIKFGDKLWGMTIFDRQAAGLYIFDCGPANGREDRVQACVHLWARFWNWVGLPHSFQYFVPATTKVEKMAESGMASIHWLMKTLRDQVGPVMVPTELSILKKHFHIGAFDADLRLQGSILPCLDWFPVGSPKTSGAARVTMIIKVMLCNELGLRQHAAPFSHAFGRASYIATMNPWRRIEDIGVAAVTSIHFSRRDFWTSHGGPQLVFLTNEMPGEYDENASRRHHWNIARNVYSIEIDPQRLRQRPNTPIQWNIEPHTLGDLPFRHPHTQLQVRSLVPDDENETETSKYTHTYLSNEHPLGPRDIHTLLIGLTDAKVLVQANGVRVFSVNLEAESVNLGPKISTPLTFVLDEIPGWTQNGGRGDDDDDDGDDNDDDDNDNGGQIEDDDVVLIPMEIETETHGSDTSTGADPTGSDPVGDQDDTVEGIQGPAHGESTDIANGETLNDIDDGTDGTDRETQLPVPPAGTKRSRDDDEGEVEVEGHETSNTNSSQHPPPTIPRGGSTRGTGTGTAQLSTVPRRRLPSQAVSQASPPDGRPQKRARRDSTSLGNSEGRGPE